MKIGYQQNEMILTIYYEKNKGWLYRSRNRKKKQTQKKGKFWSNVSETGGNWEHKFEQQNNSINNCKFF